MCTSLHRLHNLLPPFRPTLLGATTERPFQFLPTHWLYQIGESAFILLQLMVSSYRQPQGHSAHLATRLRRSSRTSKIPDHPNYSPHLQWPKLAIHVLPTISSSSLPLQAHTQGRAQVVVSARRFPRTHGRHTPLRPSLLRK